MATVSDDERDESDADPELPDEQTDGGTDEGRYTRRKCVLITGCSSGIGRATAQAFLEKDWQVVATARDTGDLASLAEAGCETLELDVTEPEQVSRAVEHTVEYGGAIDCLVNNAGYGQMGPLEDVPTRDLHRQFDVNVYGPHRLIRAALPHMRAQGAGTIVNLSSIWGRLSFAGAGPYTSSKHALEAMSDSLRAEVEEFGIEVVLIEPGSVETEFTDRLGQELPKERTPDYESLYELFEEIQIVGWSSTFATPPSEVADAIVDAATRSDPPARYPVGQLAKYGVYARFLPERLQDVLYGVLRKFV